MCSYKKGPFVAESSSFFTIRSISTHDRSTQTSRLYSLTHWQLKRHTTTAGHWLKLFCGRYFLFQPELYSVVAIQSFALLRTTKPGAHTQRSRVMFQAVTGSCQGPNLHLQNVSQRAAASGYVCSGACVDLLEGAKLDVPILIGPVDLRYN